MRNRVVLITGFYLLALSSLSAQDIAGNLEGWVLDSEGRPVEAARLLISGPDLQGPREAMTGAAGHFLVLALPAGACSIRIQHPEYQEASVRDVIIRLGRTTSLGEIRLSAKVQDMREVVVSAERPLLDPLSTSGSSNLEIGVAETLPVKRDYRSLTLLFPQATEMYANEDANFAGATGLENRYFIDGIETTDPFRGVSGTRLPYNFVKEIEVRTGGYEAEYRSSLGGIVNIVTSSGGNAFSGQAFGYFTDHRFSSAPRMGAYEPPAGDFSQYDFGISLSGPLVRDRLWYFAAYNPTVEREQVNLPDQGDFLDKSTTHIFAGKLTWQASPKTNIVFVAVGDPTSRDGVGDTWGQAGPYAHFLNPDPYLERIRRGGVNLALKATHMAGERFFLESSFSWITRREQNLPATERGRDERSFVDLETNTVSGGSGGWMDDLSTQATFSLKGTWLLDRHTIKGGLEYRYNALDNDWTWSFLFRYSDDYFEDFFAHSEGALRARIPSLYIQDSWAVTRRLRLNYGLRWDGQDLVATDGRVSQRISDQFQPRFGVLYQPGELGTQRIVASFGRFYEDLMLYGMTFYGTDIGSWGFTSYDHDPRVDPSGGESLILPNQILPRVDGLKGQHYDEMTLGYDRRLGKTFRLGARGIYRTLRQAIEDGIDPDTGAGFWGNPGRGALRAFPKARREYAALELTLESFGGRRFDFFTSYVLSRNYGNYTGLSDGGYALPNAGSQFDNWTDENFAKYGTGLLGNDRTHVFKFSGSYRWPMGLTVGTFMLWESGTPLSEWGGSSTAILIVPIRQLGSAGRTPAILDLNVRFTYALSHLMKSRWAPKIFLDVFHLGSRGKPVDFDQLHYYRADESGAQLDPNPNYGVATRYFPPMSARMGFEIAF